MNLLPQKREPVLQRLFSGWPCENHLAIHLSSPANRNHQRALGPMRRPRGAATGSPKDRRSSWDFGGRAALRRAPDSRIRDSRSTPDSSASVMPETSTTNSLPFRMDLAVVQDCSRSSTRFPANSPRRINWNFLALSCWNISMGVHRNTSLQAAVEELDQPRS